MAYQHVRLELSPAAVATLTIARPETLNALGTQTVAELREAVEEAPRIGARCLLLTGEGRGFSSGADLAGSGGLPDDAGEALEKGFNPLVEALFALPIPVVAAVNGPCAGAGCSLALAADIVSAARSAYVLQAFVNVGRGAGAGASWLGTGARAPAASRMKAAKTRRGRWRRGWRRARRSRSGSSAASPARLRTCR